MHKCNILLILHFFTPQPLPFMWLVPACLETLCFFSLQKINLKYPMLQERESGGLTASYRFSLSIYLLLIYSATSGVSCRTRAPHGRAQTSAVAQGPECSAFIAGSMWAQLLCGLWPVGSQFPSQGLNPCGQVLSPRPLYCEGDSQPLDCRGSPPAFQTSLLFSVPSPPHIWMFLLRPIPESFAVLLCKKWSCFLLSHGMSVGIQATQVCQVRGLPHRCFPGSYTLLLLSFLLFSLTLQSDNLK